MGFAFITIHPFTFQPSIQKIKVSHYSWHVRRERSLLRASLACPQGRDLLTLQE
jgi:hypothetical protein